jgi:hypothetical protein
MCRVAEGFKSMPLLPQTFGCLSSHPFNCILSTACLRPDATSPPVSQIVMAELAALSLACNIFQIISFSRECFQLLKEVYKDGQPNAAAAERTKHLSKLSRDLRNSLACDETSLREPSESCLRISKELRHELDKVCSGRSKLRIFGKALIKRTKIERLEKEMQRSESQLRNALLIDAR